MNAKTFRDWLLSYRRDNWIRDLADDSRGFTQWTTADDLDLVIRRFMGCRDALDALKAAKRAYAHYVAKITSKE